MASDQYPLRRQYQSLLRRQQQQKSSDRLVRELAERIQQSQELLARRQQALPVVDYPEQLPIANKRDEIAEAILNHQVVVVAGETGSGKTTQLPKICLELGRGVKGLIGHTQPRRLAARTVAQRIAEELKTPLGQGVGYQVRFTDNTSPLSHIKLMTDGVLLAEIQRDRFLNKYDTIIIDEAHERSLNIDFLLGYLKQLLPKRPDLKVIITSATIDVDSFARHFNDAPVIEVSGRTYPVEVVYQPLEDISEQGDLASGIQRAIEDYVLRDRGVGGDVLVFLAGEGEIREVARHLRRCEWQHCEVLPLYARLSAAEQNKVFKLDKRRGRRIILATNVAETSLTVPGIRYVIDPGYARINRYSYRTKVQRLPIEPISQASANQRKGRCGRVAEGVCIRLYEESDFLSRPEFTDPEIQRTNLASVILQMLTLRLGDIDRFPFVDPPDRRLINDGFKLLEELGAVDKKHQLSEVGRILARFPVDPRLARMIIAAKDKGALQEVLLIVSGLSIQDPRERPADKQQASDEKHRRFWDKESDFFAYVNLWNYFEEKRQQLSQSQLRKLCQREFLSFLRMREWRDIHRQLCLLVKDLGYKQNQQPADFQSIHKALLAGLMSHIANLDEDKIYLGARNRKLRIFPGSALFKKTPKWIVTAEIAETTQVYARCCARIEPDWLLGINDALFKRSYSEPHWQQKSGRVMAFEKLSLYGLVIRDRQRIHYGPIDPVLSREVFIRGALVEGRFNSRAKFFAHNRQLVDEIHDMEAKSRRRDILVDDQQLFEFYDRRIAPGITTARRFEQWCKAAEQEQPRLLFMSRQQLMQHSAAAITEAQFPDVIRIGDVSFALSYHFEPGKPDDGVTVTLPLGLLNRVPRYQFEWLVPGLLRDKCIAVLKTLPKQIRKQLVPVPDFADRILANVSACDRPLLEVLAEQLKQLLRIQVQPEDWQVQGLDDFYRMNYRVVDGEGQLLASSRSLHTLLDEFKGMVTETLQAEVEQQFQKNNIKQWDFGELPETYQFQQAGVTVTSYPALVDRKDSVDIELKDFPEEAQLSSRRGLARLIMLQLPQLIKQLKKDLLRGNTISLQLAGISQQRDQWMEDLLYSAVFRVFIADKELPRDEQAFQRRVKAHKSDLQTEAIVLAKLLEAIAKEYSEVRKALKNANQLAWAFSVADVKRQLEMLFAPGFIVDTPVQWLEQYPRYLKAVAHRLDKLRGNFNRDKQLMVGLEALTEPLLTVWENNQQAQRMSENLLQFRWLLEEYRVSLFAQSLGTLQPVSEKRLRQQWLDIKNGLAKPSA
jgi:ATP-dependent helicase HrpA